LIWRNLARSAADQRRTPRPFRRTGFSCFVADSGPDLMTSSGGISSSDATSGLFNEVEKSRPDGLSARKTNLSTNEYPDIGRRTWQRGQQTRASQQTHVPAGGPSNKRLRERHRSRPPSSEMSQNRLCRREQCRSSLLPCLQTPFFRLVFSDVTWEYKGISQILDYGSEDWPDAPSVCQLDCLCQIGRFLQHGKQAHSGTM